MPPRDLGSDPPRTASAPTRRLQEFLQSVVYRGPRLAVDLEVVHTIYQSFERAMGGKSIYYAVKANPAPEILRIMADRGAGFDTASIPEIEHVLRLGVAANRIAFTNTIKKADDIAHAHRLGVRIFAFDAEPELEKIAARAPNSQVFCRVFDDDVGADWPLSDKFGCPPGHAVELLVRARQLGLEVRGVSFHVGSQQRRPQAWDEALGTVSDIYRACESRGLVLPAINTGGGFPAQHYQQEAPGIEQYATAIDDALRRHFGSRIPEVVVEPGRALVADAGVIEAEVVLISRRVPDAPRWVYLDIGRFGGLAETEGEAIRYRIRTPHDGDPTEPFVLAGPTCDSIDVLYEKNPYYLPESLRIGDRILIESTGAYTATYSSVGFNGFAPLETHCI